MNNDPLMVFCPYCGVNPGQNCLKRSNLNKISRLNQPHKARTEAAISHNVKKRAREDAEYIRFEKLIMPDSLEELIKLAAKYNKEEAGATIRKLCNTIGADESTYMASYPIEELFIEWVENASKNN